MKSSIQPRARWVRRAAVLIALSLTIASTCATSALAFGVIAPVGYRAFCQRFAHDDLCVDRPAAVTLPVTPWLEKFLGEINRLLESPPDVDIGRDPLWPSGVLDSPRRNTGRLRRLRAGKIRASCDGWAFQGAPCR